MEAYFVCRECGADHTDPAEARLGHLVLCLDCAFAAEIATAGAASAEREPPLAA